MDIVLTARTDTGGLIVGRVFMSDGLTPGAGFPVFVGAYDRFTGTISALDRTIADATGTFAFSRTLPSGGYDVVAVDAGTQQLGIARAAVLPHQTTSVSIVLEATGVVEGVVFSPSGQPVPGALVAGGLAIVETNANGFFRLEGVPAGRRTIQAGDPVTFKRGSADLTVLAGQTVSAAVTLEARATITGRVLDANGAPVPRATVRLPVIGGYTFVFANDSGVYRFPDLGLGEYLIQAPGPSRESLIEFLSENGYDPRIAFTAGDIPPELGGSSSGSAGDRNAILAAYQAAVRAFLNVDETLVTGLPMANLGGFGWNKVRLFQDSTTAVADVKFLSQGTVSGRTTDADNRPTGALTRVTGLTVSQTGAPTVKELGRLTTSPITGAFSFSGIPRFDLATFQTAGIRGGDFTLQAATPFSPTIAQLRGQLNTTTPNLSDLVLRFPGASETNGTIKGRVLAPGGGPAPANTQVLISFGDLTVLTDGEGRFVFPQVPPGTYKLSVEATGFKKLERTGILLVANDKLALGDIVVQVGATSETVTVTAEATLVQAESGERSYAVQGEVVRNIAVNGRNFAALAAISQGLVPINAPSGDSRVDDITQISANGLRTSANNLQIDGVATVDTGNNGQLVQVTLDAIAEFKVLTSN